MAIDAFVKIFQSKLVSSSRADRFTYPKPLNPHQVQYLSSPNSELELKTVLDSMAPLKCPGPNGIQDRFYQQYWNDLRPSIVGFVNQCFNSGGVPPSM